MSMEPAEVIGNICRVEGDDNVGLSDIIDILNTLDNQSPELNGTPPALEAQILTSAANITTTTFPPPTSSSSLNQLSSTLQQQQHQQQHPQQQQQLPNIQNSAGNKATQKPHIKIVEQPAGKALRFRYECEGRSAGSIPGVHSTPENKTFPTIEIAGFRGNVVVVVSCVTKDPPFRPHPHNLVGKDGCKNGICTLKLTGEPLRASFSNLGIQCVKKKDIKNALDVRQKMKVDPFKTKFGHKDQPSSIDLNVVRLCFQAFLEIGNDFKPLTPVVSDPIYDKKAMSDLVICRLCSCSAKVGGGDEIILLCEKVAKDDIKVKFYEVNNEDHVVWEDYADFQQTDIHKQTAIAFRTPRYHNTEITDKAKVFIQLVRPSDGITSEQIPFEYYPDPDQIKRKRLKTGGTPMTILRRELQKHDQASFQVDFKDVSNPPNVNFWNPPYMQEIKTEPAMSPHHFGPHRSPNQMSPSPQPPSPMNRNTTPSPSPGGLMKAMSGSSQTQMCEMFNMSLMQEQKNHLGYDLPQHQHQQQQQQQQHQQQQQYQYNINPFFVHNNGNSYICDENKFVPVMETHNAHNNNNNNNTNPFMGNMTAASHNRTSGGSITPIWSTQTNQQNMPLIHSMNIIETSQANIMHTPQLGVQQQQQLPNDINILANSNAEEGPTLSGLLATFVDSEQLMNINSDDLPLSNLSITT